MVSGKPVFRAVEMPLHTPARISTQIMERTNLGTRPICDSAVPSLEARRQAEQRRLDGQKSARERNRLGQFATPTRLALDIAEHAFRLRDGRDAKVRFLEPSIGTGSFYSALRQVYPPDCIGKATGVELDSSFTASARDLWRRTGLTVIQGDFTRLKPDRSYNLVLANPPYVQHHHLSRDYKGRLRPLVSARHGIGISGLAGLYCHFLILCDGWLEDGGLAAWLIPGEYMDVNYGAAVKESLTERVKLLHIHRFSPKDVQFSDALVTSSIAVFEKAAPPPSHEVLFSRGGSICHPTSVESVPLPALRGARKWSSLPCNGTESRSHSATLGDFFHIKRGIATGANGLFVLDRQEALDRGIPDEFLRPVLPSSRIIRDSVIDAGDDGHPKLGRSLVVIDCDLPEEVVRQRYPRFWSYLEAGKRQGVHEGYLASRRCPWYSQERREAAPYLCTYMGRQGSSGNPFRFFPNRSQAIATNAYLLLYPKGALKEALDSRPELFDVILGILHGIKAEDLIGGGRVYGGGLHELEPKELACLPAEAIAEAIRGSPLARK
jgi:adenine-specific DNA-methyltransferase